MVGSWRTSAPKLKVRNAELVRAGQRPDRVAKEFEPSATTIRRWVKQAHLDDRPRKDELMATHRRTSRVLDELEMALMQP